MLHSAVPAHQKRADFRAALASGRLLRLPGAFNPLSARLVERKGFDGVYISGAVLSADLGLPDIGLTTLSEVAGRGAQIARVTDLPALIDADTGFGEPMNIARTVQMIEDAGIAGLHIEDQVNPKRCGHLDGKQVVGLDVALRRIKAAVDARRDPGLLVMARTDVRAIEGLDAAKDRAKALVDAGADAIFPEAMTDLSEFEAIRQAVDVPVLANMTEFGKSALFTTDQLASVGVNIVIYPVSLLRIAMGAADRALDTLLADGTLEAEVPAMQTRTDLYDLLDYGSYSAFDGGVFDFSLDGHHHTRA
ncbi:methylisocitrate lyase [Herbiconiux sp. L3-i23]|uniref:methylisocitrate lyase n=1 Tax=Herbiconiux sp. L3-i23 TaxID=2905871 RepID=UPI0020672C2C|nr:methylisocitrate lyase [Herbiconiux sp. L3-i23]BDI22371.1 2-methylisocitrate lyase [Herbiconiux sp. L3-i23]